MNILITGACGVTSRSVARSLKNSGYYSSSKLIGTDVCYDIFGLYEGLYHRVYRVPWANEESYRNVVLDICTREAIDIAVVIPEPEVLYWSENAMPIKSLLPPPRFSRHAISKKNLYQCLKGTNLIPRYQIVDRQSVVNGDLGELAYPVWMRDFGSGSTSGRGAIRVSDLDEARAWAVLNPKLDAFMVSEYLPGRNLACCLLFKDDIVLKVACYERLEYFMAKVVPSGVSGNISKGRLVNDSEARDISERAVRHICRLTGEVMNGLVTVDLRGDYQDMFRVTEINLRHTAPTSFYSDGGANMAEAQILATVDRLDQIGEIEVQFPRNNLMLRDIDGAPIWLEDYKEISIGQSVPQF